MGRSATPCLRPLASVATYHRAAGFMVEKTAGWLLPEAARAGWNFARSGATIFPAWPLKATAPRPWWRAASAREGEKEVEFSWRLGVFLILRTLTALPRLFTSLINIARQDSRRRRPRGVVCPMRHGAGGGLPDLGPQIGQCGRQGQRHPGGGEGLRVRKWLGLFRKPLS